MYCFVMIQGKKRIERKIAACSTFEATRTGLNTAAFTGAPVSIFCKPLERKAA
jgi:hypothetical protein